MDGFICRAFFIGLVVYSLVYPQLTFTQSDPLTLQQQAIRRMDNVIETFRKTGDISSAGELAQAERELALSNQMLEERSDWSALALGLIKHGSIQRLRSNWSLAIELYGRAGEAARRAGNVAYQADALAWGALAEWSRRNLGPAMTNAT